MKKISKRDIKKLISKRNLNSNKTDFGKTLIIGGEKKHIGAAIMATLAATRSGSGYVYLMSDLKKFDLLKYPDFILSNFSIPFLKDKKDFSIVIGPGLGTSSSKKKIFNYLIKNNFPKVVVDADALTILSKMKNKRVPSSWIVTPHEGEMKRILGVKNQISKSNRVAFALKLQEKLGCHVLLKGPENIFIDSKGKTYSAKFGNVALAKAGTGDVLAGIIAAHLNFNKNPIESMLIGSFIHGEAAQRYVKKGNSNKSLRPLDIIEEISKII